MRLIGNLTTESDAVRFGDYLLSIGMPNHVEAGRAGDWQVWVDHDDHIEQATAQLHAYQAFPANPQYSAASAHADLIRRNAAAEAERRRRQHVDVRTAWSGLKTRPTPVAIACIVICVLVGLMTRFSMDQDPGKAANELQTRTVEALEFQPVSAIVDPANPDLIREGYGHGNPMTMFSSIARGEVWRLITPIFLHGDIIHILFNMTWVVSLGRMIEARKGSLFLASLVLGSAIISNCGEALWSVYAPKSFGYTGFGGFSGVNYALFGYAWIKGRFQPYEGVGVNQQTIGLMLAWLVMCIFGVIPHVANAAHVAGLVIGVAVGYAPTMRRKIGAR